MAGSPDRGRPRSGSGGIFNYRCQKLRLLYPNIYFFTLIAIFRMVRSFHVVPIPKFLSINDVFKKLRHILLSSGFYITVLPLYIILLCLVQESQPW